MNQKFWEQIFKIKIYLKLKQFPISTIMDTSLQAGRTPGTEWKKKKLKKSEDASKLTM